MTEWNSPLPPPWKSVKYEKPDDMPDWVAWLAVIKSYVYILVACVI